ncbi:MAG: hypothetical protein V1656_01300 [Candidatus Jorgensenbacteria bacterium]
MRQTVAAIILIFLFALAAPSSTRAFSLFSPFSGKVTAWLPEAVGCAEITAAISIATLGTVNVTIEELEVGTEKPVTLGLLRVDGATVPGLTTIYRNSTYFIPGVNVLGLSLNLCNFCEQVGDVPFVGKICDIPIVGNVLKAVCDITGSTCPFTNLIYSIGSSLLPAK